MQFRRLLTLILAATSLFALSSCVSYDDGYGYGNGSVYENRGYRDYNRVGFGSSRSVCPVCGYSTCRCGRSGYPGIGRSSWGYRDRYDHNDRYQRGYRHPSRYDDHDNHDHNRSSSSKRSSNEYRIAGGSVGSKTKPTGYHSVDWYRARGYDTSKLTLKNESGSTYRRPSSSSSSSRSSSSSNRSSGSSARSSSSGSSSSKKSSSSSSRKSSSGSSSSKKSSGITGGAAGTGRGAMRQ